MQKKLDSYFKNPISKVLLLASFCGAFSDIWPSVTPITRALKLSRKVYLRESSQQIVPSSISNVVSLKTGQKLTLFSYNPVFNLAGSYFFYTIDLDTNHLAIVNKVLQSGTSVAVNFSLDGSSGSYAATMQAYNTQTQQPIFTNPVTLQSANIPTYVFGSNQPWYPNGVVSSGVLVNGFVEYQRTAGKSASVVVDAQAKFKEIQGSFLNTWILIKPAVSIDITNIPANQQITIKSDFTSFFFWVQNYNPNNPSDTSGVIDIDFSNEISKINSLIKSNNVIYLRYQIKNSNDQTKPPFIVTVNAYDSTGTFLEQLYTGYNGSADSILGLGRINYQLENDSKQYQLPGYGIDFNPMQTSAIYQNLLIKISKNPSATPKAATPKATNITIPTIPATQTISPTVPSATTTQKITLPSKNVKNIWYKSSNGQNITANTIVIPQNSQFMKNLLGSASNVYLHVVTSSDNKQVTITATDELGNTIAGSGLATLSGQPFTSVSLVISYTDGTPEGVFALTNSADLYDLRVKIEMPVTPTILASKNVNQVKSLLGIRYVQTLNMVLNSDGSMPWFDITFPGINTGYAFVDNPWGGSGIQTALDNTPNSNFDWEIVASKINSANSGSDGVDMILAAFDQNGNYMSQPWQTSNQSSLQNMALFIFDGYTGNQLSGSPIVFPAANYTGSTGTLPKITKVSQSSPIGIGALNMPTGLNITTYPFVITIPATTAPTQTATTSGNDLDSNSGFDPIL